MGYHNVGVSPFATELYPEMPSTTPAHLTPELDAAMAGTLGQPTVNQALQETNTRIPSVYGNSTTGQFFVNGLLFDADDHTQALESEKYLVEPATQTPQGAGWQPLDTEGFQGYINSIKDPTLGTIASKNFGIGVDTLQMLGGNAMQAIGDATGIDYLSETGASIADQQIDDLSKTEVYRTEFTDIENGSDAVNWFVGNAAQMAPNAIESLLTFLGGYVVGGGNPLTGIPSGIAALSAKTIGKKQLAKEFKEAMQAARDAKKAGQGFKTLPKIHQKRLRQATGMTAVLANNYAFGLGDLYGELKDTDPDGALVKSFLGAFPYALAESMPEMLLAGRLMGGIRGKGGKLRRLTTGLTVGAAAEGSTEAAQEALLLLSNPEVDLTSEEGIHRLINSFAAGAGFGGPIGGIANLTGRKRKRVITDGETNLLETSTEPEVEPSDSTSGTEESFSGTVENVSQIDAEIIEIQQEIKQASSEGNIFKIETLNQRLENLKVERAKLGKEVRLTEEQLRAMVIAQVMGEQAGPVTVPTQAEQAEQAEQAGPVTVPTEAQTLEQADLQQAQVDSLAQAQVGAQEQIDASAAAVEAAAVDPDIAENTAKALEWEEQQLKLQQIEEDAKQAEFDKEEAAYNAQLQAEAEQAALVPEPVQVENPVQVVDTYNRFVQRVNAQLGSEGLNFPAFHELSAGAQVEFSKVAGEVNAMLETGGNINEIKALVRQATYDVDAADKKRGLLLQNKKLKKPKKPASGAKEINKLKKTVKKLKKEQVDARAKAQTDIAKIVEKAAKKVSSTKKKSEARKVVNLKKEQRKLNKLQTKLKNKQKEIDKLKTDAKKLGIDQPLFDAKTPPKKADIKAAEKRAKDTAKAEKVEKDKAIADAKEAKAKQQELDFSSKEEKEAKPKVVTPAAKPISKPKAVARWVKFRPLWAKTLGIQFADLPASVQELLSTPQRGKTELPTQKEILAELESDVNWSSIAAAMEGSTEIETLVDRLYDGHHNTKSIIVKAVDALAAGKFPADTVNAIKLEVLGRMVGAGKSKTLIISKSNGTTTHGKFVDILGFREDLVQDGFTISWYNPETKKTEHDSKVIRRENAADAAAQLDIDRLEAAEQAEDDRRNTLTDDQRDVEDALSVSGLLERLQNRTINIVHLRIKGNPDIAAIQEAYKKLGTVGKAFVIGDGKLSDYFTSDGKLKLDTSHPYETGTKFFKPSTAVKGEYYTVGVSKNEKIAVTKALRDKHATPLQQLKAELNGLNQQIQEFDTTGVHNLDKYEELTGQASDVAIRIEELTDAETARTDKKSANEAAVEGLEQETTDNILITQQADKRTRETATADVAIARKEKAKADRALQTAEAVAEEAEIAYTDEKTEELQEAWDAAAEGVNKAVAAVTEAEIALNAAKGIPTDQDTLGGFKRADRKVDAPMGVAKIKALVKAFIKKVKVTPKVHVFKDAADLKEANPELFARAAATRLPGEFENTQAMGFSFDNDIIIFSDYILDARQLKHTIAHEIIGHHGLRSILSKKELKKVLMDIYNNDAHVRLLAKRTADLQDVSLLEAIEEVMADKAAALDISIVVRVWNAMKTALNKLGMTFGDEASRYWVGHLRKYAKTGSSSFVNSEQILRNIRSHERSRSRGRFAIGADHDNIVGAWHESHAYNNTVEKYFGSAEPWRRLITDPTFKNYSKEVGGITRVIGKSLEAVQTLNHKANKSPGLSLIYHFFQDTGNKSKDIMNHLEQMLPTKFLTGTTEVQKQRAYQILAAVSMYRGVTVESLMTTHKNAKVIKVNPVTGRFEIDAKVLADLVAVSEMSLADVRKGMKVVVGELEEKGDEAYQGINTLPIFGSNPETSWIHDESITEQSPEWLMYLEHRKAVAQAAANVLLGETQGALDEQKTTIDEFLKIKGTTGSNLDDTDIKFLTKIFEKYLAIKNEGDYNLIAPKTDEEAIELLKKATEQGKKAEEFISSALRGIHNPKKIEDLEAAVNGKGENAKTFEGMNVSGILESVKRIRDKGITENQTNGIQNIIQNLWLNDSIVRSQKAGMLRTVLGAYVPLVRDGKFQVSIKAYEVLDNGVLGAPIKLNPHTKSMLLYTQTDSETAARSMMTNFNESNIGTVKLANTEGTVKNVRLQAEYSETRLESPRSGPVGYNDLIQSLTGAGLQMSPNQRETLVKKSAAFKGKARRSLPRAMSPGFEQEKGLKHVAGYLETQAHVAAKSEYRHKISRVMDDNDMWRGSYSLLKSKAKLVDDAYEQYQKNPIDANAARLDIAKTNFERYAYMYRHSAPVSDIHLGKDGKKSTTLTMEVGGKTYNLKLEGKGERYRDDAARVVAWYEQSRDVVTSTEDALSGKWGSKLKMVTVLGQLGGNFATAFVNLTSIPMHTIPYLASYNADRGIGGGFGFARSHMEVGRAMADLKNHKFGTEQFLADMVKGWPKGKEDNWVNEYGLNLDETEWLLFETRLGILSPAQFNALAGSSRGGMEKATTIKAVKGWMYMFTYTEQLNRRTTALASYRLYREKMLAGNPQATKQELRDLASKEANKVVDETQGNYDMYNRPQMARGNFLQYPFMYKQFVLTSVQMLKSMSASGRLYYLGLMFLVAGFKGIPFADDLMDIIDTLAQFFGIKMSSVELAAHKMLDEVAPGWAPQIMNGFADKFTGSTLSTRLGHGDLIPLTGMFKAGASFEREATNLFGPVYSMATGLGGTGVGITKWFGEVLGFKPDTTTLNDIARESPIAALRAIADGYAYHDDGVITNATGKVVSKDMNTATVVARILGFYPAAATAENRIVKISKGVSDYTASIRKEFQVAYVKAKINKNHSEIRHIMKQVRDWNNTTRGTEFYIRNFTKNANRAAKEAMRPTAERYLKSSPKNMRKDTQWLMDLYGL